MDSRTVAMATGRTKCVCVRARATKPLYYIRGLYFTAISGLGRFGWGGCPRQRLRPPESCRPPGPRSCQLARYPRTLPPPLRRPLCPSLRAGFLADPHEIGRFEGIGPDLWELGAASTRASVGREPVTAEDCGSDCGSGVSNWARTPTGF